MKLVYICSRYRADATHTVEEAVDSALYACSVAISKGYAPIAPHLYLPRCLDDNEPAERAAGTAAGLAFLAVCDEVWQWGKTITEGMAAELARAKELGIPIKVYNTLGIPYEQWNSMGKAKQERQRLLFRTGTLDAGQHGAVPAGSQRQAQTRVKRRQPAYYVTDPRTQPQAGRSTRPHRGAAGGLAAHRAVCPRGGARLGLLGQRGSNKWGVPL